MWSHNIHWWQVEGREIMTVYTVAMWEGRKERRQTWKTGPWGVEAILFPGKCTVGLYVHFLRLLNDLFLLEYNIMWTYPTVWKSRWVQSINVKSFAKVSGIQYHELIFLLKNIPRPHCQWVSMNVSKKKGPKILKMILVDYDIVCYPSLRKNVLLIVQGPCLFSHIFPNSYHNSQLRTVKIINF